MKIGSRNNHMVDVLFALALFCVFAASALMVVLIGANVYQNTLRRADENFAGRSSLTYVATKVRQNDLENGVLLQTLDGAPCLVLNQEVEGESYQTWIYHHGGALRESTVLNNAAIDPDNGLVIMEVSEFYFEEEGGLLRLTSVDEAGRSVSRTLAPRCGLRAAS